MLGASRGVYCMPDLIIFNCIAVNGMQTNAGIMVGDNVASGWDSNNKNQMSTGLVFGAGNLFPANVGIICDNDIVDIPIVDNNIQPQKNTQI